MNDEGAENTTSEDRILKASSLSWPRFGVSEAMFLAGIPALAYLMSFVHELGFCLAFGIPLSFIQPSTVSFLIAVFGVIIALFPLIAVFNLLPTMIQHCWNGSAIQFGALRVLLGAISISICLIVLGSSVAQTATVFFVSIVMFGFLEFVFPLITQREVEGYSEKLQAQELVERQVIVLVDLVNLLPVYWRFIVIGIFLCLVFSIGLGAGSANNQRKFMVPVSHPETVVLRHYSQYFVLAKFDRKTKVLSSEFILLPTDSELGFTLEEVGPLSRKND